MTRCQVPHCGGRVYELPPDDVIHVPAGEARQPDLCCSLCGRGAPTRTPAGNELRTRLALPSVRSGAGRGDERGIYGQA